MASRRATPTLEEIEADRQDVAEAVAARDVILPPPSAAPAPTVEAPPSPPIGPRAPRRIREVDIPEYPGYKLTVWVNYPPKLFDQMVEGTRDESLAAANQIFVSNNNWLYEEYDLDGMVIAVKPYPDMHTHEFWDTISNELAALMIAVLRKEIGELPNSIMRQRAR